MNGVLVVRCECDHLCACHSQTKKFRAKSVAKTTTSSKQKKNGSTAKHELPLKHYVEIVSTAACACTEFIHWHVMVISISGVMKLHTEHFEIDLKFTW